MNLTNFRNLDQAAQLYHIAYMILGQNPRLMRGDDMDGPVCRFHNGKIPAEVQIDLRSLEETPESGLRHSASTYRMSPKQLDGHPFVDLGPLGGANYIHMHSINIESPFDKYVVGDMIPVTFGSSVKLKMPLTQEMIDNSSTIFVRLTTSQ